MPCNAQTILGGVISSTTTLTIAESPYLVTSNLLVAPNVQLIVEPGVVVRFHDVQLLLRGHLLAHGTATDSIIFEGATNGIATWDGIRIDNYSTAKVDVKYFRGRNAESFLKDDRNLGEDTVIKAVHSRFDNNRILLDAYGSSYSDTRRYFDRCVLTNNQTNCDIGAGSIFKNTVFMNGSVGVRNYYSGALLTIVDSCTFSNFEFIAVGEKVKVTNSVFHDNGKAIAFHTFTQVHGCTIFDNDIGIYVGMTGINTPNSATQNTICNNGNNIELMYGGDFFAPDNCWCLEDSMAIRNTMHDFFSESGLGVVNYSPFIADCAVPTSVEMIELEAVKPFIYPNPNNGHFFLEFSEPTTTVRHFSVHDAFGRRLFQGTALAGVVREELDLSRFGSGLYFVTVRDQFGVVCEKVVAE